MITKIDKKYKYEKSNNCDTALYDATFLYGV